MFTGIIQALGTVLAVDATARSQGGHTPAHRLTLEIGPLAEGLATGASVAVQGVCLTLAGRDGSRADFDVVPETWRRSTLADLRPRDTVHLERALRIGDALDGHFVQGHVDGVGRISEIDRGGGEWKLWVRTAAELMPYIVPKGAIALDGTSLTIIEVADDRFSVALVPTTLARTTFAQRRPGDRVNIETDILARLIVQRLAALHGAGGLTLERLAAGGFLP